MEDWKKIKHLYARIGFGIRAGDWFQKKESRLSKERSDILHPRKEVNQLSLPKAFIRLQKKYWNSSEPAMRKAEDQAGELMKNVGMEWLNLMAESEHPLLEKMCLFWHGHFACFSEYPHFAVQQINLIREHALGNFKDLVLGIVKNPSMILYLDGQENHKDKANENFARELMELFTIGIGSYTEKDIKEAGRAFTGWEVEHFQTTSTLIPENHDNGIKIFMGKTGRFGVEDIVDIILEKKETALFIAKKIYRYFVNVKENNQHINELAEVFYQSDYDIRKMMEYLIKSEWFYQPQNIGTKIKSPIELIAGLMHNLDIQLEHPEESEDLQWGLGQALFFPPNVAGWPSGRAWIDHSSLNIRVNISYHMLIDMDSAPELSFFQELYEDKDDATMAGILIDHLLHTPLSIPDVHIHGPKWSEDKFEQLQFLLYKVTSLPEYQMC